MQIPQQLNAAETLQKALPNAVLEVKTFRDETTLIIDPAQVVNVVRALRECRDDESETDGRGCTHCNRLAPSEVEGLHGREFYATTPNLHG